MITKSILFVGMMLMLSTNLSQAQGTISFETIPGGSPSDGLVISNQFVKTHGVSFVLDDGSHPVLAKVGPPATAFYSGQGDVGADEIELGAGVGSYFLTTYNPASTEFNALNVNYSTPVKEASGYLLDVDPTQSYPYLTEGWEIQARDSSSNILETLTILSTDPDAGDMKATFWSFSRASEDIASLKFVFVGTKPPYNVGVAFDNFSPAKVQAVDFILKTCRALAIEWESVEGVEYQVQWSDRVGDTNWYNLGEAVIGNGTTNQFFHPIKGKENRRFYRVLISN